MCEAQRTGYSQRICQRYSTNFYRIDKSAKLTVPPKAPSWGPTIAKWISDTHHSEPTVAGMEHRGNTVFLSFGLAKQKKHQKYALASVDFKIQESRYRGVVLDIQLNSHGRWTNTT